MVLIVWLRMSQTARSAATGRRLAAAIRQERLIMTLSLNSKKEILNRRALEPVCLYTAIVSFVGSAPFRSFLRFWLLPLLALSRCFGARNCPLTEGSAGTG